MQVVSKLSINPFPGLRSKTFPVLFLSLCIGLSQTRAQITDDFSDGELTSNPAWSGSTASFVVNASGQLQLGATTAGTSSISLNFPVSLRDESIWEVYIKQAFAPSSANFSRYYLMSDQADLAGPLNGYFIQLGEAGSNDAVELFRQSGTTLTSVARAANAAIASAFELRMKVTRDVNGHWEVLVDHAGGWNFTLASSGTDDTHRGSSFTGWLCTYTITNATDFYLDDVYCAATPAPDITPPGVEFVKALSATSVEVAFSEPLDAESARELAHYSVQGSNPAEVVLSDDQHTVQATFTAAFPNGYESSLHVENVRDEAGNVLPPTDVSFLFFEEADVAYGDLVISEILPDPSPQIGLPAFEFLEIFSLAAGPVQLGGYTVFDGSSSGTCPDYILHPGEYVIICPSGAVAEFQGFGPALGLPNFPTLNNSADRLRFANREHTVVDSVDYHIGWYGDEDKASGGWSLERINPGTSCKLENNWTASLNERGGTPGTQNSIYNNEPDVTGPKLVNVRREYDQTLQLIFDENLSGDMPSGSTYAIEPYVRVITAARTEGTLNEIALTLGTALDSSTTYRITAYDVIDCRGNRIEKGYNQFELRQDRIAPQVLAAEALSSKVVQVYFSEIVDSASATTASNYFIETIGGPDIAVVNSAKRYAELSFSTDLKNGVTYRLRISSVSDRAGNSLDTIVSIFHFVPGPVLVKDVVITEFMADPGPPVGLPEAEFIELFNRSNNPVNLEGWTVSDDTYVATLLPFILMPRSYVLLTKSALEFGGHQNVLATDIPSLNNSGDLIRLADAEGNAIDSVRYSAAWYGTADAADGGWSLELIDVDNLCAGEKNWVASEADAGGTPGFLNSVATTLADNSGPSVVSVIAADPMTVHIAFNERLDAAPPLPGDISTQPPLQIAKLAFTDQSLTGLVLTLAHPMADSETYTMHLSGIYDCSGNRLQDAFTAMVLVLPERALPGDVVINEILFNPRSTGVDFVEIYNCSDKIIDLKKWKIANPLAASGEEEVLLDVNHSLFRPGEFRVFTAGPDVLKAEYVLGHEKHFRLVDLPPFNDDEGAIILSDAEGSLMDSLYYSEDLHSVFLKESEGVSLERVSVSPPTDSPSNWASASSLVGFATPGYENSNARADFPAQQTIVVEPEVIQPYDYTRSFARIRYEFADPGLVGNVRIFDQRGHTVKHLAENELLGVKGFFRWDGDHDDGSAASTGYYLVWFEVFDADGSVKTFRKRLAIF